MDQSLVSSPLIVRPSDAASSPAPCGSGAAAATMRYSRVLRPEYHDNHPQFLRKGFADLGRPAAPSEFVGCRRTANPDRSCVAGASNLTVRLRDSRDENPELQR